MRTLIMFFALLWLTGCQSITVAVNRNDATGVITADTKTKQEQPVKLISDATVEGRVDGNTASVPESAVGAAFGQ